MEQKLNIAEILRNKPENTKLYSPIFGECVFRYIKDETNDICVKTQYDEIRFFNFEGLYNEGGECLLFPSKEMRDWSRFAWKRGDILAGYAGWAVMVIFDKWYDDTYTSFYCKHYFNCEDKNHPVYYSEFLCTTVQYSFKNNQYANHDYLKAIEEKLGGKLNRETLEIEKTPLEFKDGDILFVRCAKYSYIEIFDYSKVNSGLHDHASLNIKTHKLDISGHYIIYKDNIVEIRLATEEEKQQLFDALAKEGKRWDAKKKQIIDFKLKPFDKVLVRNTDTEEWFPGFFEKFDNAWNKPYHIMHLRSMTDFAFKQCVSYEGNEYLLGTKNDPK